MKILATSDLHGCLDACRPPECDVFIIAGDVCPMDDHGPARQLDYLDKEFREFLERIPAKHIIGIAGNHDFAFEHQPSAVDKLDLPWTYLRDSSVTIDGVKFYGLPWVPNLIHWAFYATKQQLDERYNAVPQDTDVVISHGPPYFIGDLSKIGNINCGARQANNMMARVKPKAFICGHIHEGFGKYSYRGQHGSKTDVYNVSFLDELYALRVPYGIVDIKIDAIEESSDGERPIRGAIADKGQPQQSAEESIASVPTMADAADATTDTFDSQ